MAKEIVVIQKRWPHLTGNIEIECDPSLPPRVKLGLAVKVAVKAGAVLTGADLTGADLTGAVLTGADLRRADLTGADLRRADLTGADLTRAVLTGAVLTDADLTGADLTGADLTGAVLTGADLRRADLTGADLTRAVLTGAVLTGADLRRADLTGADLTRADLTGAVLTDADLTRADLTGAPKIENIHQTVYAAASMRGALDMSDWHVNYGCKTAHCRAGWVTTLAGEEGAKLEAKIGTAGAATLIYLASDPALARVPDFYCGNDEALADMKRLAEAEALKGAAEAEGMR